MDDHLPPDPTMRAVVIEARLAARYRKLKAASEASIPPPASEQRPLSSRMPVSTAMESERRPLPAAAPPAAMSIGGGLVPMGDRSLLMLGASTVAAGSHSAWSNPNEVSMAYRWSIMPSSSSSGLPADLTGRITALARERSGACPVRVQDLRGTCPVGLTTLALSVRLSGEKPYHRSLHSAQEAPAKPPSGRPARLSSNDACGVWISPCWRGDSVIFKPDPSFRDGCDRMRSSLSQLRQEMDQFEVHTNTLAPSCILGLA
jgi:hypothetical protein